MLTIVIDASCLIDLRKGGLVSGLLSLPSRFVVPHLLFEKELPDIPAHEKAMLVESGLEVRRLTSDQMQRSILVQSEYEQLSIYDCSVIIAATDIDDSILLAGDKRLRESALQQGIEVHGALWAIDEIHAAQILPPQNLYGALVIFNEDPTVWLPRDEHMSRLRKFKKLIHR